MSAKTSRAQLKHKTRWIGVGVHPTPTGLIHTLSQAITSVLKSDAIDFGTRFRSLAVADLFAGDGRLGRTMALAIAKNFKVPVHTTFVEFDPALARTIRRASRNDQIVIADAFEHSAENIGYNAVVANPPFLALTEKSAKRLALPWGDVKQRGRNLYGLAMARAISVCQPGGLIALICPYGWLRGAHSRLLRKDILQSCDEAHVIALSSRKAFPGVQQDIALHLFRKRRSNSLNGHAKILFSIEGRESEEILLHTEPAGKEFVDHFKVRVGPLVWNRERNALTSLAGNRIRVLYGGNIEPDETLDWSNRRYKKRQFLRFNAQISRSATKGPAIAIRRVLRGFPGEWEIDSCAIGKSVRFIAENHVILVKVPSRFRQTDTKKLQEKLKKQIQKLTGSLGSPNLTGDIVSRALNRAIAN